VNALTAPQLPVRLELSADFSLSYTCGNEYDPANPYGQCVLTMGADGRVRLDNRRHGSARTWTAGIELGTVAELVALLNTAGFPVVPPHQILPGSTRTLLIRTRGRELRTLPAGFHEVHRWPGYQDLYHLLDSVIVETSRGTLPVVAKPRTGLVRGVSADAA
jgi:hypothetical protein